MIHTQPPIRVAPHVGAITLFLAGSIEMDVAERWQDKTVEALKDCEVLHIYNPRRTAWDSSWKQTPDDPNFKDQVQWEMSHLDRSDIKAFYFDPATKSPITLLELGLSLKHLARLEFKDGTDTSLLVKNQKDQRLVICCPDGFWRKGNVEIALNEYRGLKVQPDFENFIRVIRDIYNEFFEARALAYATKGHDGQVRKYHGSPYIEHPIRVANAVKGLNLGSTMVAAAYLHDVVEDCGVPLPYLTERFGPTVAKLVGELTNPSKDSKANRETRKKMDRDHIAAASKEAKIIKMLDRTDNIRDIQSGPVDFGFKYCHESRQLLDVIKDADETLAKKLFDGIVATEEALRKKVK